jgi:hypothetical protein
VKIFFLTLVPAICVIVGWFHVPSPVSAEKERQTFAREKLNNALLPSTPTINTPATGIELGKQLQFLGANLPKNAIPPGDTVDLDFYFKTLKPLDRNWKIFLHIDPTQQGRRIHGDHSPVQGKYPTNLWQKDEILKDNHRQTIPSNAAAGAYTIWLGFYVGDERLPITKGNKPHHDGSNRIRAGTIRVGQK